jgi:hypothetical protein
MYHSKKILLMGMFASLLLLLFVPTVMAFSDEPCTGVNYECPTCTDCVAPPSSPPTEGEPYTYTDPASGWTVKLWIQERDGGLKEWYYDASKNGSVSGLKKIDWGYPNCCTTPVTYISPGTNSGGLSTPGNLSVFLNGEGAPSGFGESIPIMNIAQASPDNTSIFKLVTNTDKMTMGVVNLELAGSDRAFSYPVPACASAAPTAFAGDRNSYSTECREVINDCLDVDKNPDTACTNVKLSVYIPKENGVIKLTEVIWHPYTTDCGTTCEEGLSDGQLSDCQNGLSPSSLANPTARNSLIVAANPSPEVKVEPAPYYCSGLGDERQSECIRVEIGSLIACTQSGLYASCYDLCPYYYRYLGYYPSGCP